jgi:formate hydrogenlyase subunit 4
MIDWSQSIGWLAFTCMTMIMPPVLIGIIRKIKARLQGRQGASILQPFFDLSKLLAKGETLSEHASWIFRGSAAANVVVVLLIALCAPWFSYSPRIPHTDLFLFVYMLALLRFLTVISSLDASSPFGGFAASREVTLAVLVEPAVVLSLVSLGIMSKTSDMSVIFSYTNTTLAYQSGLWFLAGCGLYLSSLVELCRMPADDPTTHLELTMVHEAMIIENSGPNLALMEYANALKLLIFMGLAGQCMAHAIPQIWTDGSIVQAAAGIGALAGLVVLTAMIEGCAVKMRWTKMPEFISYAVTFALLCAVCVSGA